MKDKFSIFYLFAFFLLTSFKWRMGSSDEYETSVEDRNIMSHFSLEKTATLRLTATVMCAILYAGGSYMTAYIPSPWGFGQFRPAVVVPAFFAVIFGPAPAGLGAALGTLIADSVKHGTLYMGSLLAAVPGNFIAFYLFGYMCKKFSWGRFVATTNVTLTLANFVTAFLYLYLFKQLYLQTLELSLMDLTVLSLGLTLWWFVTMLPFVFLVTPVLIKAVAHSFPSIVPVEVKNSSLEQDLPSYTFTLSLVIPGAVLLILGLAATFTPLGAFLASTNKILTIDPFQTLLYGSGVALLSMGLYSYRRSRA